MAKSNKPRGGLHRPTAAFANSRATELSADVIAMCESGEYVTPKEISRGGGLADILREKQMTRAEVRAYATTLWAKKKAGKPLSEDDEQFLDKYPQAAVALDKVTVAKAKLKNALLFSRMPGSGGLAAILTANNANSDGAETGGEGGGCGGGGGGKGGGGGRGGGGEGGGGGGGLFAKPAAFRASES
jgi:uncharacterized membrane protein YgcG